ncbi:MAG TPA: transglycosylase SLT domain-containing protein [Paenalcaligenes hominis]|uniref:Transglycosylase SLT domain-containing protein n=1 Tax=Paenalcaligenes hominis TaxID=643674 RepID=A0A9D3AC20_9BURK|nr:transglycosylase SLT domain-containing protein [Paenalcaligenes hominis]NJB64771.1 hypothetical protein [Paenalcaligenes hominis]GGE59079.1 transglycosylase [Paenalcaligenes hominis]HJH25025.1 transglycosylase SLT domain-containing protein [Paenalcaligenes hominis]
MSSVGHPWINRSLQFVHSRLGEFVHLCAIYLGIAVLVTIAAGAAVPTIRDQAKHIYEVVVEALRPEVMSRGEYVTLGWLLHNNETEGVVINKDGDTQVTRPSPSAYTSFAQVLQQSAGGISINGVSRTQLHALRSYISRKYKLSNVITGALIQLAYENGRDKDLDPLLILAVIAIESTYNPFVESHAGAQGLMQVMTRVHQDKLEGYTEGNLAVFSPVANIRAGTQILYDCKRRRGSVTGALACYVGATGPSDGGYGAKVLAERRRIALASGIAVKD